MLSKTEIVSNVTRKFHKVGFVFKKHSPEILVGVGVVGVVATTVLACKATLKVDEVLDDSKAKIDKIKKAKEEGVTESGLPFNEEDYKKDMTIVYTQSGVQLFKLYAPAVGLGILSVGAIIGGHHILRKRNIALAAAYTAVDKSFKEYRGRVVERFGEELDKELKYNIKTKEIEEIVANEDGSEQVIKKNIEVMENEDLQYSEYAKFFDDGCTGWSKDPEYNLKFLKMQERYATNKLRSKGHLFLNEVYEMLGIPTTAAGQVVGWIYNEKEPIGDNYVDFGIYNIHREANRNFVNGYERTILLDFNVDGNILDKM